MDIFRPDGEVDRQLLKSVDVPAVIVIDALDVWMDDKSQSAFLSAVEHCIREVPKVKFLITSRPRAHILTSFRSPLPGGLADALLFMTPHRSDRQRHPTLSQP